MGGPRAPMVAPGAGRLALYAGLALVTVACTLLTGTTFHPVLRDESYLGHIARIAREPALLLSGVGYALTLLSILLVHEWGHLSAALRWGVGSSLPYFIPGPPFVTLGTFGAFIRLRTPIPTRRALLDIGSRGPFYGFTLSVAAIVLGFLLLGAGYRAPADFFGANVRLPLAFWLIRGLMTGNWGAEMVFFENPVLAAAWLGLFFQGLNLLPVGQLDGGHVVYSLSRGAHAWVGRILVACLAATALWEPQWIFWVALLLLLGLRHPPCLYESEPLKPADRWLAAAALAVFLLSFHPAPFEL